jgi:hypothetical protein
LIDIDFGKEKTIPAVMPGLRFILGYLVVEIRSTRGGGRSVPFDVKVVQKTES